MSNFFKKAAVFTDLHVGLKSNSIQHNNDCLNFVEWVIETAKKENCESCFFLGDWHHHRASINIHSLSYSLTLIEKLSKAFDKVVMIPGNHDLYYRDRRDVHSVEWAKHLHNVHLVNDFYVEGDVVFSPWLIQQDYKTLQKMSKKYLFGHFELPHFYMNAQVEMPDHGEINETHLSGFEKAFSGHFHKRQHKKNIWYIGNAFPHNYSDAGDDARGMMILEWDREPIFKSWPRQPVFRVNKLSDIIVNPEEYLLIDSHIRVHLDIEISYEEANFLRETWIPEYKLREMSLIPMKAEQIEQFNNEDLKFESVDKIVVSEINAIDSKAFDKRVLLNIYHNL